MADETDKEPAARTVSRPDLPKRFYKSVTIAGREEGHVVLLDGLPVKTPGKRTIAVPNATLAEVLAAEWEAQTEYINAGTMHATRIVNAGLDVVPAHREPIVEQLANYIGSDLLCYRADRPDGLVKRQTEIWDPVLRWAEDTCGMKFHLVEGLMPVDQPPVTAERAKAIFGEADDLSLAALHAATTLLGSAVLTIAHWKGFLDTEAAWKAAHVDEDWNFDTWGRDEDAMVRRALRWEEMRAAARVIGV
ncbi:MAG: ATP12 family protein [Pseudomonadota bacterium]